MVGARKEPLRALQAGLASLFFLFATLATFGPWFSLPLALALTGASISLGLLGFVLSHRARHALRRNPWADGSVLVSLGWLASLVGVLGSSVYNGVAVLALSPLALPVGIIVFFVAIAAHGATSGAEDVFLGRLDTRGRTSECMGCGQRISLTKGRWRGGRWLCTPCARPRARAGVKILRALLILSLAGAALFVVPAEPADAFCEILEPASDLPTEVRGTQIEIQLTEGFARVVIIKEFFNPSDRLKEGQVFFPLERGHELITDLSLKIGNIVYDSSSQDREGALDEFLDALAKGQDAALVQYDAPRDVYWIAVTIPPKESRTTITTLEMPLAKEDGYYGYDYRLSVDAGHSTEYLRLHLQVQTSAPLEDIVIPSHPDLPLLRHGTNGAEAFINSTQESEGRNLEVRFRSSGPSIGQYAEPTNTTPVRYVRFSLDSEDEALSGSLRPMPRSFLFLVDASGSMGRLGRWGVARETILALARDLRAGETFAAAAFQGRDVRRMEDFISGRTPSSERELAAFLDSVRPGGSTSLTRALPVAASWAAEAASFGQQPILILVSDGRPTVGTLAVDIEREYRRVSYDHGAPVFAIAVNPADHSDENLLRNVSHFNHGDLVTVHGGSVAGAAASVLGSIRVPVLRDVRTALPGTQEPVIASRNPQQVLQGGEAVVVARVAGVPSDPVAVELAWEGPSDAPRMFARTYAGDEIPVQPLLKRQWILSRVHGMLDEIAAHGDPGVIEDLEEFGTANRIVTPYTSLVVTIPRDNPPSPQAGETSGFDLGTNPFGTTLASPGPAGSAGFRPRFTTPLDGEAQNAEAFWDELNDPLVANAELDRYVRAGSPEHRALPLDGVVPRVTGRYVTVFEVDGELVGVLRGWMEPSGASALALWSGFWAAGAIGVLWGIVLVHRRAGGARRATDYSVRSC